MVVIYGVGSGGGYVRMGRSCWSSSLGDVHMVTGSSAGFEILSYGGGMRV